MGLDSCIADDECHVRKVFVLKHSQQIARELRLGHLHADGQHPNVVERQFAVVASEDVQLTLDNVGSVPAPRARFELGSRDLLPVVGLDVEYVDIVHPVHAVISTEVDDFTVNQAAGGGDASARLITADDRFDPGQCLGIQIKDVVQLPQLVRLSPKYVDLLVERDCGMLQAADGRYALCCDRATPFQPEQIKDQEVVQPELTVATSENEHLIVDDRRSVELPHRCFAPYNGRNVECQLVDAFLQIDENHVRQHLEPVPAAVDDDLGAIPHLAAVAHPGLWQFVFVDLWLEPRMLLRVENKYVVHDSLLTVALSAAKDY